MRCFRCCELPQAGSSYPLHLFNELQDTGHCWCLGGFPRIENRRPCPIEVTAVASDSRKAMLQRCGGNDEVRL